jgi:TetR/AcrR family transcriptional regulator, regulator of cefoperazone and chloramphenicol sensitivity
MSTVTTGRDTYERLLEAAIEVFTDDGYREATLREICRRAGANNAAVNYHFRDKEHLYLAVVERAIETMREFQVRARTDPAAPPADRLRQFVHSFLTHLLGEGPPTWLLKLVAREVAEPTAGLDLLVEKVVVPFEADLLAIVRDLAGPEASDQQVRDCGASIVAQCHQYHHERSIIFRLKRYTAYDAQTIEHLTDHITQFSLGGIRAIAAKGKST